MAVNIKITISDANVIKYKIRFCRSMKKINIIQLKSVLIQFSSVVIDGYEETKMSLKTNLNQQNDCFFVIFEDHLPLDFPLCIRCYQRVYSPLL